ncbi:hypothetical protein ASZ90_014723 [hydrocarbon metagenome]|uniref:Uncharacterized protein n=1 Tax=hydrocarbon metagenome TaxID=938273 RepID=A0A0W8F415_9ZZZZ
MIARSVSITGIAALVVTGTAMLLVTTPAPRTQLTCLTR